MSSRNEGRLGPHTAADMSSHPPEGVSTPPPQVLNFITPTEFVELPSGGSYYPPNHPLHNESVIEMKHMTTKEEDILTSQALLKKGLALERLLESLIVNKQVRVDDLLLGDKNALIISARAHGYGTTYETNVTCPSCEEKQQYEFDLGTLQSHSATEEYLENKNITLTDNNTFLIPLPTTDFVIEARLLTGHDEKAINKISEHKKKRNFPETPMTDFLRAFIISVNGVADANSLNGFINSLPALQARYIRKTYDKLVPNLDLKHDFTCPRCGHSDLLEVPLSADFFWSN
jgi:transcription elongation factor Elf1